MYTLQIYETSAVVCCQVVSPLKLNILVSTVQIVRPVHRSSYNTIKADVPIGIYSPMHNHRVTSLIIIIIIIIISSGSKCSDRVISR